MGRTLENLGKAGVGLLGKIPGAAAGALGAAGGAAKKALGMGGDEDEEGGAPRPKAPPDIRRMLEMGVPGPGGVAADIVPLAGYAERIAAHRKAEMEPGEEEAPVEGEEEALPEEEEAQPEEEGAGGDMAPLMEALSISEEDARELYDAAMSIPDLADLEPADLASRLKQDVSLYMHVKEVAARVPPKEEAEEAPIGGAQEYGEMS